jgi:hypothetical protein
MLSILMPVNYPVCCTCMYAHMYSSALQVEGSGNTGRHWAAAADWSDMWFAALDVAHCTASVSATDLYRRWDVLEDSVPLGSSCCCC